MRVTRERKRDVSYRHKQTELVYVNSHSNCVCSTRIALQFSQVFVRKRDEIPSGTKTKKKFKKTAERM